MERPATPREAYLETILRLLHQNQAPAKTTDIAARLGVSPPSVTEMIQKLAREGLVRYRPYRGATLTDEGAERARKIQRRQEVLQRFLAETLGFDADAARREASRMEPGLSDAVVERLSAFLERKEP